MPLDPLAKRFLAMTAAARPRDRSRPNAETRRQALAKLMQFARADVDAVAGIDGLMPGPAGDLRYRLYTPTGATDESLPGFVFFHGGGLVAGSIETHDRDRRGAGADDRLSPRFRGLPAGARAQVSCRGRGCDRSHALRSHACCLARH